MKLFVLLVLTLSIYSCASKPEVPDPAMVEKWPKCYHQNIKIFKKCVSMNEAGNETTAIEIENNGLPK